MALELLQADFVLAVDFLDLSAQELVLDDDFGVKGFEIVKSGVIDKHTRGKYDESK